MIRASLVGMSMVVTLTVVVGWAWGDIKGSKHDFSGKSWAGDDLCAVCHAPRGEEPPAWQASLLAPLWDPGADLTRRFGMPAPGSKGPGAGTLICLQCHDGTVASEAVAGAASGLARTDQRYRNKENQGIFGLSHDATDHPVGIEYPRRDDGFRPITSVIAQHTVVLPDGKVECTSCHDPHDHAGVEAMLVASNARSALCLACHKK